MSFLLFLRWTEGIKKRLENLLSVANLELAMRLELESNHIRAVDPTSCLKRTMYRDFLNHRYFRCLAIII